jgi:formylglycine-generating enzyme required for sulfatase activity
MQTSLLAAQLAALCTGLSLVVPAAAPMASLTESAAEPSSQPAAVNCAELGVALTGKSVLVPAGIYRPFFRDAAARSAGRAPQAPVKVAAFRLDATAVTRGEYLRFVCQHSAWRKSMVKALFAEAGYLAGWSNDLDAGTQGLEQPVTHVSWFAARAFCAARNARLPTLAEWERAGGPGEAGAADVHDNLSSEPANPFRFAMGRPAADLQHSGLTFPGIWEWTADFNSVATGNSGSGGRSGLFCGDGFRSNDARDYAAFLRYSFRSSLRGNYTLKNLGFRCVEDIAQDKEEIAP